MVDADEYDAEQLITALARGGPDFAVASGLISDDTGRLLGAQQYSLYDTKEESQGADTSADNSAVYGRPGQGTIQAKGNANPSSSTGRRLKDGPERGGHQLRLRHLAPERFQNQPRPTHPRFQGRAPHLVQAQLFPESEINQKKPATRRRPDGGRYAPA